MFFGKRGYEEKIVGEKQGKSGVFDETACVYYEWRVLRFFGVCKKLRKYSILLRAFVTDFENSAHEVFLKFILQIPE